MSKLAKAFAGTRRGTRECPCGEEMALMTTMVSAEGFQVLAYRCPACQHELRVTIWDDVSLSPQPGSGL